MRYKPSPTAKFKKEIRKMEKRNYPIHKIEEVIVELAKGNQLLPHFCDHDLSGNWKGYRECHVLPDWLLIYRYEKENLILSLVRTGTHSDLFK